MDSIDQANFAKGLPVYLEHASFAKLREVTLSMSLNPRIVEHAVPRHGAATRVSS